LKLFLKGVVETKKISTFAAPNTGTVL